MDGWGSERWERMVMNKDRFRVIYMMLWLIYKQYKSAISLVQFGFHRSRDLLCCGYVYKETICDHDNEFDRSCILRCRLL
jgi:hypothetical protein